MSKFDSGNRDTVPTRLKRNKNKPTKKKSDQEDENDQTQLLSGNPTINIRQESVDFQLEENAITGGNLNIPVDSRLVTPSTSPSALVSSSESMKTTLVRRAPGTSSKATVGWLVVVAGPGTGSSISFSYGLNKIGRDAAQDIALVFGDSEISRVDHAAIEFDPKTRKFYLSKGENLVYLNDKRVGANGEKALKQGDEIVLGMTTLCFVPFCGDDFDWSA